MLLDDDETDPLPGETCPDLVQTHCSASLSWTASSSRAAETTSRDPSDHHDSLCRITYLSCLSVAMSLYLNEEGLMTECLDLGLEVTGDGSEGDSTITLGGSMGMDLDLEISSSCVSPSSSSSTLQLLNKLVLFMILHLEDFFLVFLTLSMIQLTTRSQP